MKRATLRFTSDAGAEYLYDDVTGCIFPWGPVEDALLNRELGSVVAEDESRVLNLATAAEKDAKLNYIRRLRSCYNAFTRTVTGTPALPAVAEVKDAVWSSNMVLVLCVTENCNMACGYCVYASGTYKYSRPPSARSMTAATAIQAVDWFVASKAAQLARDPRRLYGLSFFGGEPLLNIGVIDQVMAHVEKRYPGRFIAVVTTNGTLLTPKNVDILVRHSVGAVISVDGSREEHDRRRVDVHGVGTHDRIVRNLAQIRMRHRDYWNGLLCISVYDPRTDLVATAQYFHEHGDDLPRVAFANPVAGYNTTYYDQFSSEDLRGFADRRRQLREEYKAAAAERGEIGSYQRAVVGGSIFLKALRPRMDDNKPYIPQTACCIPGFRLAVHPNGSIHICERVNGTNPIGTLDAGLDYERIISLIDEYQKAVTYKCSTCPIARLCPLCFSFTEGNGTLVERTGWCAPAIENTRACLSDYVSIMEKGGDAEFGILDDAVRYRAERSLLQA